MDEVDVHDGVHHATEPDEEQVLRELYGDPDGDGVFRAAAMRSAPTDAAMSAAVTAAAATGATGMIGAARKSLGMSGRPNTITKEYASRHGDAFLRAAWCDMAVTYWARHSGNASAVLPGGDRAYTVWHAQDLEKAGRWHSGTTAGVNQAKPGDIVFFDWGAGNSIGAIDHVGVVEAVLGGGRLQTIEGNTDDAVKRRVRGSGVIAGYGRPAYGGGNWTEDMVRKLPELSKGDKGEHVQSVQGLLQARSHPEVRMTGTFDDVTEKAVKAVQRWGKVDDDGIVGPITWSVLLRVH